ncbi:MAG: HU family DNA-binding protein [Tannerellaceae bacterium]
MALKYKTVLRKNMHKDAPADSKLVYGATKSAGKYSLDQLSSDISEVSTASEGDIRLVICGMVQMVKKALLRGETVVIDGFGNFQLKAGSTGVATEEEFKVHLMKRPNLVFRPSQSMQVVRDQAKFELIETVAKSAECDKPHSLD